MAHDACGGPGRAPRRAGDARAGRRRAAPARAGGQGRRGSPSTRPGRQAPDLAAHLRRQLRRSGASPAVDLPRGPVGRQQHRHLQLAGPRAATTARTGTSRTSRTAGPTRSASASAARTSAPPTPRWQQDRATHTATLLTLPLLGWVGQRGVVLRRPPVQLPGGGRPAGRPRPLPPDLRQRPPRRSVADRRPDPAGLRSGRRSPRSGSPRCRQKFGDAQHGGVSIYELGNEPDLWDSTHHDFHPQPTTYDELWTKSRDLAVAVKDADPGAATLGPAEWGWPNYFCSAADHVDQGCFATSPDRAAHGGTELSRVVPPAVRGLRAADRPPAARLLRPALLPAGAATPPPPTSPARSGTRPTPTRRGSTPRSTCSRGCATGCRPATRAPSSASASTTSASASPPTSGCRTSSRPTRWASSAARGSTSRRSGRTAARRSRPRVPHLPQLRRPAPPLRRPRRRGAERRPAPGVGVRRPGRRARDRSRSSSSTRRPLRCGRRSG